MDLIDRYLYAVRRWLPADQQDDVVRELSDDLRSQVEDQEAALGRPLDQAEQAEMLRQKGHPLMLASRYFPQRHVIGPTIFPIYWLVLRIALGIALLVHVVATVVLLVGGRAPGDVIGGLARLPLVPLALVFACVTVVFALIDKCVPRLPFVSGWNPESLPAVRAGSRPPSTAALVGEIVAMTVFTLWVAAVPQNQWLLFGPAWTLIELAPGALRFHLPILLLMLANMVVAWAMLLRPGWSAWRPKVRIASTLCSLALIVFLLGAGDLVIAGRSADVAAAGRLGSLMNLVLRVGLGVSVVVTVVEAVRALVRRVSAARAPGKWSPRRG